jgi:hypothetical protein
MKHTLQYIKVEYDEPILVLCDNTSSINIFNNIVLYSKTKHIPINFQFLREHVIEKNIKIEYIRTK